MKLVIEISKSDYEYIKKLDRIGVGECLIDNVYEGIRKGIVLPEGHGRLIDADDIDYIADFMGNWTSEERIKNTSPTIIEADGGGEDEDRKSL